VFRYRYDTETQLYYLNSRYYNPEWGRFINADSLGGKVGDLLSHNVFAYCKNNPVNMSDPSGHWPKWAKWAAVAVVAVVAVAVIAVVAPEVIPAIACAVSDAYYAAGAAITVTGWRVANAASNLVRGTPASAATLERTAINVTEEVVKEAVKGDPLKTQQPSVSLPVIQRYVDRLAQGEIPPGIKVDSGIIVDGNHRYIASKIMGIAIEQIEWMGGRPDKAVDLIKLFVDPSDWGNK